MTPVEKIEYLVSLTPPISEGRTKCVCGEIVTGIRDDYETCCTTTKCPRCRRDVLVYFLVPESKNPSTQKLNLTYYYRTDPLFYVLVNQGASPAEIILELLKNLDWTRKKLIEAVKEAPPVMFLDPAQSGEKEKS